MLTVACVLRVGGKTYNETWVRRLHANVSKHLTIPYRFVCLTNLKKINDIETIELTEGFPGWWSKIELFKPKQFTGPVLYMDLDLMVCGNIDKLADSKNEMVMLRDCPVFRHVANSGLMYWNGSDPIYQNIFNDFSAHPFKTMMKYSGVNGVTMYGDQGFIEKSIINYGKNIQKWQDILPSEWFLEFSYLDKINPIVEDGTYNKDVRICYSLGYPKFPNMPHLPIVKEHWVG